MLKKENVLKHISLIVVFFFITQTFLPAAFAFDTGTGDMHGGTPTGETHAEPDKGEKEPEQDPIKNECKAGDPISLHTGEYTYEKDDLIIPGQGISLRITHTYKNRRQFNGRWGYGWFLNYDMKIKQLENNNILFIDETGRKNEYIKNGTDYNSPPGHDNTLTGNPDGTFTISFKKGLKYEFDVNGCLAKIIDNNSNAISFTYDEAGKLPITGKSRFFVTQESGVISYDYKLTKITDTSGREVLFSYDATGRLEKILDPMNRENSYSYDENNNLTKITESGGGYYLYKYDEKHCLTSITNPEGGEFVKNTYDEQSRVSEHFENGQTFNLTYGEKKNDNNEVICKTATLTQSNGTVIYYELSNCCGTPLKVIRDYGEDKMNLTWTYTYDDFMNMTSETDPKGNTIQYEYDDKGNVLSVTDPDGNATTYTYNEKYSLVKSITDALGRLTKFEYDSNGNFTKITDPLGNVSAFSYDLHGNLLNATDAEGNYTTFTYNNHGYITSVKDVLNHTTNLTYDNLGNVLSITNAKSSTLVFTYDTQKQVTQIIDTLGNITRFEYDKNGKKTKMYDALNNVTSWKYDVYKRITSITDALNNVTSFDYDENGNLAKITDAKGNITRHEYDCLGRLVKNINPSENTTEYTYDSNSNLTSITDANSNLTSYAYDRLNRLTMVTFPDTSNEAYAYNQVGNLVSKTDRKNNMTAYTYDELNRLITKTYKSTSKQVNYSYNKLGRLTSVSNDSSTNSFIYDKLGRIIQSMQNGRTVWYEYDNAGNRTKLTYPDGTFITYTYDSLNRVNQIRNFTDQIIADYSYDQLNRRTQVITGNGIQTNYQYNLVNMLTSLNNKIRTSQALISSFTYAYDKIGNKTAMTTSNGIHSYTYDKISQLIHVDYPTGYTFSDKDYLFDKLGNRTRVVNGGTEEYLVNNLNQYTYIGLAKYTYDANGNLAGNNINTYAYDDENRLISAQDQDGTVYFAYDSFGRRISKENRGTKTFYVYDGNQVIAEYNANGDLLRKFIYGTGIDEPIIMEAGGLKYFYHTDGLGSITEITNTAGNIVEQYEYDVYGKISIKDSQGDSLQESEVNNPYFFTGRRYDKETGLYYYRARYYSSEMGRFLQPDPVGYYDSMNLYGYALNNPVNWVDPMGNQSCEENCKKNAHAHQKGCLEKFLSSVSNCLFSLSPICARDAIVQAKYCQQDSNTYFGDCIQNCQQHQKCEVKNSEQDEEIEQLKQERDQLKQEIEQLKEQKEIRRNQVYYMDVEDWTHNNYECPEGELCM